MWRMMPRLAIATLTATLALALAYGPEAHASTSASYASTSPTFSFATTGSVSDITGTQPIEFYGLFGSGSLSATSLTPIGQFITNTLPATATLTDTNTPFVIDMNVVMPPGSPMAHYDYKIQGVLNGSITGNGQSNMMAYVTVITGNDYGTGATPPFSSSELRFNAPLLIAAPNGQVSGFSTLTSRLEIPGLPPPLAAPEPTSFVVFGMAAAGWYIRRRRLRSKLND